MGEYRRQRENLHQARVNLSVKRADYSGNRKDGTDAKDTIKIDRTCQIRGKVA